MIILVSIVDKHLPKGRRHVGNYCFEIDYPAGHAGQFDYMVFDCPAEREGTIRPMLNKLTSAEDTLEPIRGDGSAYQRPTKPGE